MESKDKVIKLYREGKSMKSISRDLGIHFTNVRNLLIAEGEFSPTFSRKFTEEKRKIALELFDKGVPMTKISKEIGINNNTISEYLRVVGVDTFKNNRKYDYDENIFATIDSESKAYWLGFLSADGYITEQTKNEGLTVSSKKLGLALKESDLNHVEKFCDFIGISREVIEHRSKTNSYRITVSSSKMCDDLVRLGVTPRKSYTLRLNQDVLGGKYARHYLRGFYDGDGYIGKSRSSLEITSASENTLNDLQDHFKRTLNVKPKTYYYDKRSGAIRLRHDKKSTLTIIDYLYRDSNIHLDRKHDRAVAHLSQHHKETGK